MNYTDIRNKSLKGLEQAEAKIQEALKQQKEGKPMSSEVKKALKTFFPKQGVSFLPILLKRIQLVKKNVIPHVRLKLISLNTITSNDIDKKFHEEVITKSTVPAVSLSHRKYIALYSPHWENHKPYQSGILIHESFHYYFKFVRGHKGDRRKNAFAYQGIVSKLGGLSIGKGLKNNLGLVTHNPPTVSDPPSEHLQCLPPNEIQKPKNQCIE